MGLDKAQPMKGNDGFFWEGKKNLAIYEKEFEIHFLEKIREVYDKKATKWISECTALEYLKLADNVFEHEENYCTNLLQAETKPKLIKRVEQELISKRN